MNRLLFTHIDLDGYGARIIVQKVYPDITVKHVDYGFDTLPENRQLMAEADVIIFTDISISEETAVLLEKTREKTGKRLLLLDHHKSAYDNLRLLNYDWIRIDQSRSGALLAYEFFHNSGYELEGYYDLSKFISDYDLWQHNYKESKILQFLWSKDQDYFLKKFLNDPCVRFNDEEMAMIQESLDAYEDSYNSAMNTISIHKDLGDMTFGLISSVGSFASLVADRIMKENRNIDYLVLMNNRGSLSFRSLHYEVRKIAEALGGGGHKLAAGAGIPTRGVVDIVDSIMCREWKFVELNIGADLPK